MTAEPRLRWFVRGVLLTGLAGAIALVAWHRLSGTGGRDIPLYGDVPPFALVERSGRAVRAEDLRGRIWVADFVFTRCAGTCPALSTALAALLRRLEQRGATDVLAVSFSVDPTHDDPPTLRRYAEQFGADPARWLFVTGDAAAVARLVRDGFKLATTTASPDTGASTQGPITHSDRFVLVDSRLRIRGYYPGIGAEGVAALERDLLHLRGQQP